MQLHVHHWFQATRHCIEQSTHNALQLSALTINICCRMFCAGVSWEHHKIATFSMQSLFYTVNAYENYLIISIIVHDNTPHLHPGPVLTMLLIGHQKQSD